MCLIVGSEPVRLEADLTVYKILNDANQSPYREFQYQPNTEYKTPAELKEVVVRTVYRDRKTVHEGFHAFVSTDDAKELMKTMTWRGTFKVVKFIMRKGSVVIFGNSGDVVCASIYSGSLEPVQ